ncbi:hypothetical protein [Lacisediminihabitans profunda]|uniref:Protein tyrosine phosphatase n=1 Tax=Lacisediminihabitans profunda TaxID=2594790 RepID=A0A5C8URJ2_9MICO|nr:hypothetical protein [Lacisediminihabitans profunda]TXN31125.1 hypothetical protein FVP33_05920 [Lacisediminihabitans profunda]
MSFFTVLVTSKIAIGALALGTVAAGGTAVAAYTGTLPAPLQQSAHSLIGAPAPADSTEVDATATADPTETPDPTATPNPTATPVGPDATGPAAFGLCTAFTHGGLSTSSTAYKSLVVAASNSTDIKAYCATIVHPGKTAAPSDVSTGAPALPDQSSKGTSHKPTTPGRP